MLNVAAHHEPGGGRTDVTTVAVGLAKDIFEAALANRAGRIVDGRRLSAAQFGQFVDSLATGTEVVTEACATAHYWCDPQKSLTRTFQAAGRSTRGQSRRSARDGTKARARSTARRILILSRPLGRRSCVNVNLELRRRARASRRSAVSFFTRRRSSRISCWSSNVFRFVTSMLTATLGAVRSQRGAVERGTPSETAAAVTTSRAGRAECPCGQLSCP